MQKRNFGQAKKQRESARKARQQEKLERKHARSLKPAQDDPASPEQTGSDPKEVS